MGAEVLYKVSTCSIEHDRETDYLIIRWRGFPKSDEFRNACNLVLKFMRDLDIKKLLTDNREAKVFGVADQNWLNEDWFPRALAIGYYASATLINDDVFVKSAISKIMKTRKESKVLNKSFINENEAIKWLESL